jgi:hypothetical protein
MMILLQAMNLYETFTITQEYVMYRSTTCCPLTSINLIMS